MATWFDKAVKRALEGEAKVKYFQHSGCLLTADGTDDELIYKFEVAPAGYKLNITYPYYTLINRLNSLSFGVFL